MPRPRMVKHRVRAAQTFEHGGQTIEVPEETVELPEGDIPFIRNGWFFGSVSSVVETRKELLRRFALYAIERVPESDRYVLLNHNYLPLGKTTGEGGPLSVLRVQERQQLEPHERQLLDDRDWRHHPRQRVVENPRGLDLAYQLCPWFYRLWSADELDLRFARKVQDGRLYFLFRKSDPPWISKAQEEKWWRRMALVFRHATPTRSEIRRAKERLPLASRS